MKKIIFVAFLFGSMLFMGYNPDVYYPYTPVFMQRSEMERAVKLETPAPIKNPGKIYIKDHYIFINEKYKGFHVIDNSNPSSPIQIGFIHVDGCLDIAIKGNTIYADNAIDLIAMSFPADLSSITVTGRVRNAFPEPSSPEGYWYNQQFENFRPKNGIVVRWETSGYMQEKK
jgi:hypothetical protein